MSSEVESTVIPTNNYIASMVFVVILNKRCRPLAFNVVIIASLTSCVSLFWLYFMRNHRKVVLLPFLIPRGVSRIVDFVGLFDCLIPHMACTCCLGCRCKRMQMEVAARNRCGPQSISSLGLLPCALAFLPMCFTRMPVQ